MIKQCIATALIIGAIALSTAAGHAQQTAVTSGGTTAAGQSMSQDDLVKVLRTKMAEATSTCLLNQGDMVEVKVYQEEDLTTRARVEADGTITMPLIGTVKIGGKTVADARQQIYSLLEKDYLRSPDVTLTIVEPAKRRFCILGEVRQPGFYLIPENETITLLQAIAMAGGYTDFAQPTSIRIKRVSHGVETILAVDAKAMARKESVKLEKIEANDTILVSAKLF